MRNFLLIVLLSLALPGLSFAEKSPSMENEEEVSANEDLMREHGILNRLLLIYQEIARRIDNHEQVDVSSLAKSVTTVRNFLEDYHEKLEEEFIFPKFEKAGKQLELVKTLREQHQAGRGLTEYPFSREGRIFKRRYSKVAVI